MPFLVELARHLSCALDTIRTRLRRGAGRTAGSQEARRLSNKGG